MSRRLVIDDGRAQRELLLVGTMVVGRDPACEISHGDPRLSRRHAEFRIAPDGVVVQDLQSRNGIKVNGVPVEQAVLTPGDTVQIANLVLRFVDDAQAVAGSQRVAMDGRSGPVAVATGFEDDRTRMAPSPGLAVMPTAVTEPIVLPSGPEDDRTRAAGAVAPALTRASGRTAVAPGAAVAIAAPVSATGSAGQFTDVGDLTIRGRAPEAPAVGIDFGVAGLLGRPWGRRVLAQGVLLALVVFLVTAIPMLAWHARSGAVAMSAIGMLVPPFVAAVFAGLLVATLIARTTARGVQDDTGRKGR